MPTKCIDHTPVESVSADPASARRLRKPSAESSSRASDKPTKLPWTAMAMERATSQGSCGIVIPRLPCASPPERQTLPAQRGPCNELPLYFLGNIGRSPEERRVSAAGLAPFSIPSNRHFEGGVTYCIQGYRNFGFVRFFCSGSLSSLQKRV